MPASPLFLDDGRMPPGDAAIELTFPANADLVVLARLVTTAVATRAGFDIEELDDLRLAVDELCLSAADAHVPGSLVLRLLPGDAQVEVAVKFLPASRTDDGGAGPLSTLPPASSVDLSARILDALVDDHGRTVSDDGTTAWFCKRRAGAGASADAGPRIRVNDLPPPAAP